MKILLLIITTITLSISQQNITLTKAQEKSWQIKLEKPILSKNLFLGEYIGRVVTPPSLLYSVSLPFKANVIHLRVANYQYVKRGDILAEITGVKWIELQQKAISKAIEYEHHSHLAKRKNMLCKEGIISRKKCIASNAELRKDEIEITAFKTLLKSYWANNKTIQKLFSSFVLSPTIKITSRVSGRLIKVNVSPGESTNISDALFVIKKKGRLWFEANIEAKKIKNLKEGSVVKIKFNDNDLSNVKILQISPIINPINQTKQIRFLLPKNIKLSSGLRTNIKIYSNKTNLKIKKTSVVKYNNKKIVFKKIANGYEMVAVEILAEGNDYYYVKFIKFDNKIASSSVIVLKNLLGDNDE